METMPTWAGAGLAGRLGAGCHVRVANEAVQGDLWWSSFAAREARSKAAYDGRLRLTAIGHLARKVFDYVSANCILNAG